VVYFNLKKKLVRHRYVSVCMYVMLYKGVNDIQHIFLTMKEGPYLGYTLRTNIDISPTSPDT
jgi:hypothetical protein